MKAQDQSGICLIAVCADAHSAGLSTLLLCFSRMDHSGPKRTASSTRATIGIRICYPLNISIKFFFCNVLVLAILFFTSGNGIHNLALR